MTVRVLYANKKFGWDVRPSIAIAYLLGCTNEIPAQLMDIPYPSGVVRGV